jgi:hypothetical protein
MTADLIASRNTRSAQNARTEPRAQNYDVARAARAPIRRIWRGAQPQPRTRSHDIDCHPQTPSIGELRGLAIHETSLAGANDL